VTGFPEGASLPSPVPPVISWMAQLARNVILAARGSLSPGQRLIRDGDAKFSAGFVATVEEARGRGTRRRPGTR
jgi:hypothetical protein